MHRWVAILTVLLTTLATMAQGAAAPSTFRALWVTRWDYRSQEDVRRVMAEAASLGVTDVFWQVRGQGDAFYKSSLEPWGRELFRDLPASATEPGYDPLALAVQEAKARKLRIHAWINVMPLWKGTAPPRPLGETSSPRHPLLAHPEWRLYDAKGAPQPLNEHYVIINPIYPEAQDHVVAVARDIMTRYALDGLHLDYIRFVSDTMKDASAFPGDERSIDLFRKATGRSSVSSPEDQAAFRAFIRDRITDLVRRLKKEAVAARPGAVLTAAVWRRPDLARDTYLQDAAAWLKEGAIDRALPMIYQDDNKVFESDLDAWIAAVGAPSLPRLTPGLGNYKHQPAQTGEQITMARAKGVDSIAIFAYASLFESVDPNQSKKPEEVRQRVERRRALTSFFGN